MTKPTVSGRALSIAAWVPAMVLLAACGASGGPGFVANQEPVQNFQIDVTTVRVDGDFMINGVPAPASTYEQGEVRIEGNRGAPGSLGRTHQSYEAILCAGEYLLTYHHLLGSIVPRNEGPILARNVPLLLDQSIDIDIPAVAVTPSFALDGAPFPVSTYESAELFLKPSLGGPLIPLGRTNNPPEPVQVFPGRYDVIYSHLGGSLVPGNKHAVVMSDVLVSADMALHIDVPSGECSAVFTLDGAPFPASTYHWGEFCLVNPDSGDTLEVGSSLDVQIEFRMIPGTYAVVYRHRAGTVVPRNNAAVVEESIQLSAPLTNILVDVQTAEITPAPSLNGAAFPTERRERADFFLVKDDESDCVFIGASNDPAAPTRVVRGTYDILYQHVSGSTVPANRHAIVARNVVVDTDALLPIDLAADAVRAEITVDGTDLDDLGRGDIATVFGQGSHPDDRFPLASTDGADPVAVLDSFFEVWVTIEVGRDLPANGNFRILDNVPSDQPIVAADIETVLVQIDFTLDGVAWPASTYENGGFYLRDATGDETYLGRSNTPMEPIRVIPGAYEVLYKHAIGDTIVPQNEVAFIGVIAVSSDP